MNLRRIWPSGSRVAAGLLCVILVPQTGMAQASSSYKLLSKGFGSVGGRSVSPSYVLNGIGGESLAPYRSVGQRYGVRSGFYATVDRTGPGFDFFVSQNTLYSRSAAIYVFPSEPLAGDPTVRLNGSPLPLTSLAFATGTAYSSTRDLAAGTNALVGSGVDRLGNAGSSSTSFSAAFLFRRSGGAIESPDRRLRLSVGEGALAEDATVVCAQYDYASLLRLSRRGLSGFPGTPGVLEGEARLPGVAVTPFYVFGERLGELGGRSKIEFRYGDLLGPGESPTTLAIYRTRDGEWERLEETWLDPTLETIVAFTRGGGVFRVRLREAPKDGGTRDEGLPEAYSLSPNYPNPFNPTTRINFALPRDARIRLVIYDVRGARVRTLVDEARPAGHYSEVWNGIDDRGRRVASGVYFYRLDSAEFRQTRKMILLK